MLSDHFWTPSRSQGRRCPFLGKLRWFPRSRRRVGQPSIKPLSSAAPPFLSATSSPACPSSPLSSALEPGPGRDMGPAQVLASEQELLQGCSCRAPMHGPCNLTSLKSLDPWMGLLLPPHLDHPRYWLCLGEQAVLIGILCHDGLSENAGHSGMLDGVKPLGWDPERAGLGEERPKIGVSGFTSLPRSRGLSDHTATSQVLWGESARDQILAFWTPCSLLAAAAPQLNPGENLHPRAMEASSHQPLG